MFRREHGSCSLFPASLLPSFLLLSSCLLVALSAASCGPAEEQPIPRIRAVQPDRLEVARYGKLELTVALEAVYDNPYDVRQVGLTAVFTGPDGREWVVPGFWDGEEAWRVRFAPSVAGEWRYSLYVRDRQGENDPWEGQFTCLPSGHHGWLQVGDWVDPAHSARYLVHHDGTPFYGVGHCNAFDLMSYGWDAQGGFTLFDRMAAHGENMLVYWPIYSNPFFATDYDHYSLPDLKVIDMVVEDAVRRSLYLVFTIWNHDLLRDETHPWSRTNMGDWGTQNGFRKLGSLDTFFTDEEAWAWQENLYRYVIARWGYSPAIGLWQTVSEIEGTNAGPHADRWHERVNGYFVEHDPYRHPTTASMAGDAWWPAGYAVMDVAQMHSYDSQHDPVGTGPLIAGWTQRMWQAEAKPNLIGEFGSSDHRNHPELLHNGVWAGLAAGAAATPMEWNDSGAWGRMTEQMYAHMSHLAAFVADLPLAHLDPTPLELTASDRALEAWGLGGSDWGFFWVQDVSMVGAAAVEVREGVVVRSGATVTVEGLGPGTYAVRPYDTWQGVYLAESRATADESGRLTVALPPFSRDVAVRLEWKP
jgi:hypothetical protein